ncbi:MAG: hypothetical protein J7L89_09415 [Bacteroidales bacterium]|nr:hypothetical protein [Bacteroidales bacterium]
MITELIVVLLSFLAGYLLLLVLEQHQHQRRLDKIPLRITVSGTRGKTSVVRLLASVLREAGYRVMAKTTGSEAQYILPDGHTKTVVRKGSPNIIEQKKVIRLAARYRCDCLITEIMSIRPENHRVETRHLLRPHLTLITNCYPDHLNVAGPSDEDMKALYDHDRLPGAKIFTGWNAPEELNSISGDNHFEENLRLVYQTAHYLNIKTHTITKGIQKTRMDIGQPDIFQITRNEKSLFFVNAFAANDPVSTEKLIKKIRNRLPADPPLLTGLLILRKDRGARSIQWMNYLGKTEKNPFEKIYLSGLHAPVLKRKIPQCEILKSTDPETITRLIMTQSPPHTVVLGLGNIRGPGKQMIEYWQNISHHKL